MKVILVARRMWSGGNCEQHDGYRDLPIEIVHASERITMDDSAAKAVRTKRDSSMRVASRLVRDGSPRDSCRAGNTGAVMATAKMVQGVVPGVERPALARRLPDHGAERPWCWWMSAPMWIAPRSMLAQFAVMGEIYSRIILRTPQAARGNPLHRRGRAQGQRPDARRRAAAEEPATSTSSATWKAAIFTPATWT